MIKKMISDSPLEQIVPKTKPIFNIGDLIERDREQDLFRLAKGECGIVTNIYSSDLYEIYWIDTQEYQNITRFFIEITDEKIRNTQREIGKEG